MGTADEPTEEPTDAVALLLGMVDVVEKVRELRL